MYHNVLWRYIFFIEDLCVFVQTIVNFCIPFESLERFKVAYYLSSFHSALSVFNNQCDHMFYLIAAAT